MASCHNCALPEGTTNNKGRTITITVKPENGFQRQRKISVWVCCNECAWQTLAIAKYGPASFRWPITLAQFRSTHKLESNP